MTRENITISKIDPTEPEIENEPKIRKAVR